MAALSFLRFFKRAVRVTLSNPLIVAERVKIENLDGRGLHVTFDVDRTNEPQPDESVVRIYNLSDMTIGQIKLAYKHSTEPGFRRPPLKLELDAGYDGVVSSLFKGDVWDMRPKVREGGDWYTEFRAADGGDAYRGGTVNASVGGVDYRTLIDIITKSAGITTSAQAEAALATAGASTTRIEGGVVIQDTARAALDRLARDLGLKWWIRDGQLIMVKTVTTDVAVSLSPDTGLIDFDLVRNGDVEAQALLNPQIFPGRQVLISDRRGIPVGEPAYRVETTHTSGANFGGAWDVSFTGRGVRLL